MEANKRKNKLISLLTHSINSSISETQKHQQKEEEKSMITLNIQNYKNKTKAGSQIEDEEEFMKDAMRRIAEMEAKEMKNQNHNPESPVKADFSKGHQVRSQKKAQPNVQKEKGEKKKQREAIELKRKMEEESKRKKEIKKIMKQKEEIERSKIRKDEVIEKLEQKLKNLDDERNKLLESKMKNEQKSLEEQQKMKQDLLEYEERIREIKQELKQKENTKQAEKTEYQKVVNDLKRLIEQNEQKNQCILCLCEPRAKIYNKCNHLVICEKQQCLKMTKGICPFCKMEGGEFIKIYLP